jgi:hypothetical protein
MNKIIPKLLLCKFILISLSFAQEKMQVDPTSYEVINYRYNKLFNSEPYSFNIHPEYRNTFSAIPHVYALLIPNIRINTSRNTETSISSWVQLALRGNISVMNEMIIQRSSNLEMRYIGKEWRNISGHTNQSFIKWEIIHNESSSIKLLAGRFYSNNGAGRTGQLLISSASRPLDQLNINLSKNIKGYANINFDYRVASLDKIMSYNRFSSSHRLEIQRNSWYIGVSECLIYASKNGAEWTYLNPFTFYHLEQLNGPNLSGNTLGSLELGYLYDRGHIYSEILIDDLQFDENDLGDLEPNEFGVILGLEYAMSWGYLGAEIVGINNRTYKAESITEWALHRNVPLGYVLGSDLFRINFLARVYVEKSWHLDLEFDLLKQGEGELSKPWDMPWYDDSVSMDIGYSEPFPTGIVEKVQTISIGIHKSWNRERWLAIGLTNYRINNTHHIKGQHDDNITLTAKISWSFKYFKYWE